MLTTDQVAVELAFALELADRADEVSLRHFRQAALQVESKVDRSPVSEADREIERGMRQTIELARPGHAVVGEEFGQSPGTGGLRWIIDPIDGTRKFVRGIPGFATLIALENEGEMIVGVASAPALGRRWWAGRGLGAFSDGQAIHVSRVPILAEAHVGHGGLEGFVRRNQDSQLAALSAASWGTAGYGDFWIHVLVAEGGLEAAVDAQAAIWDLAALKLIVEEAGGRFTDFGGVQRADGGTALSSNGLVHNAVLALITR